MSLINKYLDYVGPLKGSRRYHKWSLFTVISALMERRIWLDRGRIGVLFPNIYTILVGKPATGKGFASGIAVNFFKQVKIAGRKNPELGPSKITSAALYERLKAVHRGYKITGYGELTHSPLFVYAPELSLNMEDFGGGTLTNELLDFYDSKSLTDIVIKQTISGGTIELTNPSLTILGCTTPSFLQQAAANRIINSGLSSRIIHVHEPTHVEKQHDPVDMDKVAENSIVASLTNIFKLQGPMTLTAEAHAFYKLLAAEVDLNCHESPGEFMQNYYGRKAENILKVAMCFTAMREDLNVNVSDLVSAQSEIESLEPTVKSIFGTRNIEKDPDLGYQILSYIDVTPTSERTLFQRIAADGKFLPQNGAYTAAIKSFITCGMLKTDIAGDETFYTKVLLKK